MALYELAVPSHPALDPMWRQFVIPFISRLGITNEWGAIWHWVYWDLERLCDERTGSFDLPKILGTSNKSFGVRSFWTNRKSTTSIVRPPQRLYKGLRMGNINTVLSSSLAALFVAAFVLAGTMSYGSPPIVGPTRDQWYQGYLKQSR
ncbi:hypothetical protein ZIOFF_074402 (mitochondrion) [Zingiber officinale]|uniref:Uncharacterized protein n=1 Tax=Zingiber officinale TaxID=94328 RepID=A0A8J5BVA3_ZINOF|nr:hypothetical protein ZIOFF_074402 [Zingiber officinale]